MNYSSPQIDAAHASERVWRFAGCEFDELSLQLRVKGRPADLELKPLEVLLQLLMRAGEVVTKEALLEAVWPGLNVVDGSLATAISKLRKALSDSDSQVVLTIPRVGYRLAVPVETGTTPIASEWKELQLQPNDVVPGREQWRLIRRLDLSHEVWLAEHVKTRELRVFKFASNEARLKGLKREVTVARFLRESLGERPEFVRVLEWNLESHPPVLESEFGGQNLTEWAREQGELKNLPLATRVSILADVAKAVAAAHEAGVLHKDLKPANILVKIQPDGSLQIKVADFGSASLIEPARLRALGITNLGLTQTLGQSPSLTGTLMYLAPEVLSGQAPKATADVYSLGAMLYQIVVGDFRKPLAPGWEADIDDPLLREDIAAAACGDPARRLKAASELAERLATLDRRRAGREQQAVAARRHEQDERRRAQTRAAIPWVLLAAVAIVALGSAFRIFYKKPVSQAASPRTIAVLPFQNLDGDPKFDFLRSALPDEVATALSYVHPLSIRPFMTTRKYDAANLDLQKAARDMGVSVVITGHFLTGQNQLQLTYEAVDVAGNHILWSDTIISPLQNLIDIRQKMYQASQAGLAVALGVRPPDGSNPAAGVPANEEAYDLYTRSITMPGDPDSNSKAKAMLERAVQLDPNFAPYWVALGGRYSNESHYIKGTLDAETRKKALVAAERALALDPHYGFAQYGLALDYTERGDLLNGYRVALTMVRESPGNEISHVAVDYVLRYAGLDQESETQCEVARSFDRQSAMLRSCGVAFLKHGDYDKALEYFNLDADSDWNHALTIDILLREGKEKEALQVRRPQIGAWSSYDMLLACAGHQPAAEISALSKRIEPDDDPESNYFAASHLAYCGQTAAALDMLKRTVRANYCSYPAMDTDPMFASLRSLPQYAEVRSAGKACMENFVAGRAKLQ